MAISSQDCSRFLLLHACMAWLGDIKVRAKCNVHEGAGRSYAVLYAGSRLQKRIFLLCIYISITFLVRAIDIKSYDHILPRAVSSFFNWSCTDALITILYVAHLLSDHVAMKVY